MKRKHHWICTIGLISAALLLNTTAALGEPPADQAIPHFRPAPVVEGTPEQCNQQIKGWLTDGVSNIVTDLGRMAQDKALVAASIATFRQRLKKDEGLGTPLAAAITNAQGVLSSLEGLLLTPQMNAETRRQTELNMEVTKRQLDLLLLNQEKIATVKKQLLELGKTCAYWEQFWSVTARATGPDETRRQLKALIEQERTRLLAWSLSEQGLR